MSSKDMDEASGLSSQDFESIREAVMETPRGRWFLSEYASRLRSSETAAMFDSMRKLETAVSANHDALMSRLAQALTNASAAAPVPAQQADLAPKHMKFFKQDEDIFEPAPQARIAAVPDAPKPEAKPEAPKGAKVVIRRTTEASVSIEATAPASNPEADTLPAHPAVQLQGEEAEPKRRIVIIRHKPGEQIDVPLQNEMAEAS